MTADDGRWRTADGKLLSAEIVQRLTEGRDLSGLDIPTRGGRVDLRGITFADPMAGITHKTGPLVAHELVGAKTVRGRTIAGIDFSGARLRSLRLFNCIIDDCVFARADCRDWRLWHSEVRGSSFSGANLRDSALGTWHEGKCDTWRSVDFSDADLRGAGLIAAVLSECNFANARLDKVQFQQCALVGCSFEGRLNEVLFDGRGMPPVPAPPDIDADFTKAFLVNVEFRGFALNNVRLPVDGDVFRIPNFECVAKRVVDLVTPDSSAPARQLRAVMENSLKGLGASTPPAADAASTFNRRDWRDWGGHQLAEMAERVVKAAQADCRT